MGGHDRQLSEWVKWKGQKEMNANTHSEYLYPVRGVNRQVG